MKKEIRDFIIPIRVTFNEKRKIKLRANRVGKNLSEYIRYSALENEIREKPDKDIIIDLTKSLRDVERAIRRISITKETTGIVDLLLLKNQREEINNIIVNLKSKLL